MYLRNSDEVTRYGGVPYRWDVYISRFSNTLAATVPQMFLQAHYRSFLIIVGTSVTVVTSGTPVAFSYTEVRISV